MHIIKSIYYSFITKSKTVIFSNTRFICKNKKGLTVKTQFQIGKKWNKSENMPTSVFIGNKATVNVESVKIYNGCKITIKKGSNFVFKSGYLNCNSQINCKNSIIIGEECAIANNVIIRDNNSHSLNGNKDDKTVEIGNHVWIGAGVIILPGAKIGDNCVIAAGSIVNKEYSSNCLIGGNPAKIIKQDIKWNNF